MTAEQLITALGKRGIEISRRTLFTYRAADPGEAPTGFDDVNAWARFILARQTYEPGRTQSTEKREAKERKATRNGRRQANGDSDAEKYSLGAERKERILRLQLSNEMRRSKLEVLRKNTVAVSECVEALEGIKRRVSGDLLKLPARLCRELAHREPRHVQEVLHTALRAALDRLAGPETYV